MLRKTLIAAVLLGASGSALAWDDVVSRPRVSIHPHVTITLGNAHHNTHPREVYYRDVYHDVYVPHRVAQPVYNNYYYSQDEGSHHWENRDRHDREWRRYDRDDHHGRREHHQDDDDD